MRCSMNAGVRKFATQLAFINHNTRSRATCEPALNISPEKRNRSNRHIDLLRLFALVLCVLVSVAAPRAHAADSPLLVAAVIRGADTYSTLQLLSAYQKYLGKPLTNPTIEDIAAKINKLYVSNGYTPPEMQLDNSQLAAGILGIEVFEAQITAVTVSGNPGPYAKILAVTRLELLAMKPLRVRGLQTALRRIRDLPGLTINVATKRSTEHRNGYDLTLDAEFKRFETQVRLTNRGTDEVGRDFLIAQTAASGLFGRDLKAGLVLGVAQSMQEFRGGGAFVEAPVTALDARATLLAFRSLSNPSENPIDADVEYIHNRLLLTVMQGWRRWGAVEAKASSAVEVDDLFVEQAGAQLQADCERVLSINSQFLWSADETTQYLTLLGLRQGWNGLGAHLNSLLPVEADRSVGFSVATAQLVRVARLRALWQLRLDVLAQFSNDVLADRERFKIGGDHLGRGFEVPAITGDRGLGGKAELRRDLPKLSTNVGKLSTYAYYDLGAAWKNSDRERQSAASAAIGVSLQGKKLFTSIELARPLTHADIDGNRRNTLFVEVSATF